MMTEKMKAFNKSSMGVQAMSVRAGFQRGRMAVDKIPVNLRDEFKARDIFLDQKEM